MGVCNYPISNPYFDSGERIPPEVDEKFGQLFREYTVSGGMTEVVSTYMRTKLRVRDCYDSIPKQLAWELKRFRYSFVEKKQTSRKYGGSIKWFKDSALVNVCYNVRKPIFLLWRTKAKGSLRFISAILVY